MDPVAPTTANGFRLTRREVETLLTLARGLTEKEAAVVMGISMGTLRVFRKRLQHKLGTRGLVPSLLVAWKLGEIDIEPLAAEAIALSAVERTRMGRRLP